MGKATVESDGDGQNGTTAALQAMRFPRWKFRH
jgi:hypothetical protein